MSIDESAEQSLHITNVVMHRCSSTRGVDIPPGMSLQIQLGLQPDESNDKAVSVTLTITSSDQDDTDNPSPDDISIVVEYLLITEEQIGDIPKDLAHRLIQIAWPYLRTTLNTIAGMASIPVLPVPLFPPGFSN